MKLFETLEKHLKNEPDFVADDGGLKKWVVMDKAQNFDAELIGLLLAERELKAAFFVEVHGSEGALVFKQSLFLQFLEQKNYLNDSYTRYKNKVGLDIDAKPLGQRNEVALVWPYKDCVLEGGQSREEQKRDEIFFNETLAQDEITQLLEPKVLTGACVYDEEGEHAFAGFTRDAGLNEARGLPKDTITDNLVIRGNNLLAMHSLTKEFSGKVKLIYIDPPYYFGAMKSEDSFAYNTNFKLSTWLTFMANRLSVARELLTLDGSVFVQISDEGAAHLKLLLDEVFGQQNFLNTISVRMKNVAGASGGGEDKRIKKNIEFIHVYSRDSGHFRPFNSVYDYEELYDEVEQYRKAGISWKYTSVLRDAGEKEYLCSTADGAGNEIKIYRRNSFTVKSISQVAKDESLAEKEVYYKYADRIFSTAMPQSSIRTRVLDAVKESGAGDIDLLSIEYTPRSGRNKGVLYEQFYKGGKLRLLSWLRDIVEERDGVLYRKELQGTYWDGLNLNNLSKEGEVELWNGKKPEALLHRIIGMATEERDIVLDYHVGSGTSSAVAHKMKRQYIGVEQMDYVQDIAVSRLKNVIAGEQGGISKDINWQGGGSFTYMELMRWNERYLREIEDAVDSGALLNVWERMKEKSFLNYNVDLKAHEESMADFQALSLEQQKQHLCGLLDKNQLYVNLSSLQDGDFSCSEQEKRLTRDFYQMEGG